MKEIKILGTGCPKCEKLAAHVEQAAENMEIRYSIEKVTDINAIMAYGVMMTPALVVDGQVKSMGKVLKIPEIEKHLQE